MDLNTEIDLGRTGAQRQSWEGGSARAAYLQIVAANPDADEDEIFELFWDACVPTAVRKVCAPYLREVVRHWARNTHRSMEPREPRRAKPPSVEAVTAAAAKVRERASKIVLLDLTMPNGKMLRDCTFGEVGTFGGMYTALGNTGQPGDKVGAVMSEKEVRAVFRR